MTIAERIRAARKAAKVTQKALAERTGISLCRLEKIEGDHGYRASKEDLENIEKVLGLPENDLMQHWKAAPWVNAIPRKQFGFGIRSRHVDGFRKFKVGE